MLASDLNNPEFTGSRDPDSGLYVEFYWHEPVDAWSSMQASREQQRNVVIKLPKQAFVRIMVPGDKTSEFTCAVDERHKQRFPRHWLAWQIAEGLIGGEEDIPGWKLAEWDEIGADMIRELQYLRFQTVEQLAGASDKQIQGIGIGGLQLREKARVALRNRMGAETRIAIEARDAENAALKEQMRVLQEQMSQLLDTKTAAPDVPSLLGDTKRGPGRPPKEHHADQAT